MSSLENGLRILNLLNDDRPILRVGEVCRDLGIPKASVSRLMRNLAEANLLEQDAKDGSYSVGIRALDLGRLFLGRHSLLDLVVTAISDLVDTFGFTGHAGIVAGTDRVLLAAKQGTYPLQHVGAVAERKPAFDSIIGRTILARKPAAEILTQLGYAALEDVRDGVRGDALLQAIDAVRGPKVAFAASLVTPGISSVGAAVADPGKGEILGFCLSYPSAAANDALAVKMSEAVAKHAREIGQRVRDPIWMR